MKKMITILISLMLLMSLSIPAFAVNPSHEDLMKYTIRGQRMMLGVAVIVGGYYCDFPICVYFQGFDKSETAYWNVDCGNRAFRIEIKNDAKGSLGIVPCDKLYLDEAPCFKPFTE